MTIALFDPSISSENLGDQIIRDAVLTELTRRMPEQQIVHLPTQEIIAKHSIRIACEADWRIVGGTNLLSAHMLRYRQWQIGWRTARRIGPVLLCGVGWWQYQGKPDAYTKAVLRAALSRDGLHSVRDEYTKQKLASIGITNVVNTGCPTMWAEGFGQEASRTKRSNAVLFTLTDYHPNPDRDRLLIGVLKSIYEDLLFWPQGKGDRRYLSSLECDDGIRVIEPSLSAFDSLLKPGAIDYVGTRLHGGIRAIQNGVRTIIVAIDNRSTELAKQTGLPVVEALNDSRLRASIIGSVPQISVNAEAIAQWRAQFG
ncbi:polysaccharide pyruvyl transferase family protein [Croceicoccus sp. Ery5]|uniref:polysaccharide pyruvyl transferase family protein n=1 Tax=Croceicoccus sp. Ery5 TaxID=1703340 RepID=UPI001E588E76|nr:polysaccharide pyruvyl transferase family protein [Croceicoccus sp. Ery5]